MFPRQASNSEFRTARAASVAVPLDFAVYPSTVSPTAEVSLVRSKAALAAGGGRVNPNLIPVRIGRGLVVLHTREEWDRFWHGVDRDIARAADSRTPLEEEQEEGSAERSPAY